MMMSASIAYAYDDSPYTIFSTSDNDVDSSLITWESVDDVQKACDDYRRKKGNKPYGENINACSFWTHTFFNKNVCHVITKKNTTMWTIGHEIRHCFQGKWHGKN